jgi:hypothetical protein
LIELIVKKKGTNQGAGRLILEVRKGEKERGREMEKWGRGG